MSITRTERGWAGHFSGADACRYRRNTLVSDGDRHLVVSTVGGYTPKGEPHPIGDNRWYETMIFHGEQYGPYIDANMQSYCGSCGGDDGVEWGIFAETFDALPDDVDLRADAMHESNVKWCMEHFDAAYASGN